jgi:UDP:flavonoid glycosyltransferase YjiC (YdhE family)
MGEAGARRVTVLLMPEGSVLAHVGRVLAIAAALERRGVSACFAASGEHTAWLAKTGKQVFPVLTRPREDLLRRLKRGGSAFDEVGLRGYVRDEVRILKEVQPDVVVGDFRPSLAISAAHVGVPHVCVTNAVWTRFCAFRLDPPRSWLPTKVLGKSLLRWLAPCLEPRVFRFYARSFNRVRREYGLPPLADLRDCMCSDDLTLVADAPELFPAEGLPPNVQYVGPVMWEPPGCGPEWLTRLDPGRATVYLTMGSTGPLARMKEVAQQLLGMGMQVVCTTATANSASWSDDPHFHAVRYCPGSLLCGVASVVVCHAGNGTIYQALAHGVPVVGVPEFHDQEFNMQQVEALGLGLRARPGRRLAENVAIAVRAVLDDRTYRQRAQALQRVLQSKNGSETAAGAILRFMGMADLEPHRTAAQVPVGAAGRK